MLVGAFVAVAVTALLGLSWLIAEDVRRRARALHEGIGPPPSIEHLPPRLRAFALETRTLRLNVRATSRSGALADGYEGPLDLLDLVRDVGAWLATFERLDEGERGAAEQAGFDPHSIVALVGKLDTHGPRPRTIRGPRGARRSSPLRELDAALARAEEAIARIRWGYRT